MAFTVNLTNTCCINSYEDVRDVFHQLNIGTLESIDSYSEMTELGPAYKGLRLCFESVADNLFAKQFYARLVSNYEREQEGETVVYPRVIYGTKRDGSDMFWYVSLCKSNERRNTISRRLPQTTISPVRIDM
jgi:hypothetical protein